ncbi:MAG TPA: molybdenum cofactor guanylyltransferase [Acidobacteriota bacterium]|nr:molybdenum cofactor guanylyltransferase [Acidobacteriota bacterium]
MPSTLFPDVSGFILAGGESRRMGVNKARLLVEGVPMIERVLRTLSAVTDDVSIVTNAPETYLRLGVPLLGDLRRDANRGAGPLAGIEAALNATTRSFSLIVACDLPFLTAEFLSLLLNYRQEAQIVVPETTGVQKPRLHSMCAVYQASVYPVVTRLLDQGERRMETLLEHTTVRRIRASEYADFPHSNRLLINVNTPDDFQAIQRHK